MNVDADEIKQAFSKNLKLYMSLADKNQSDLVRDLHFAQSSVSDWLNGKKYPRMDKVEKIAKYLGITVSDLMAPTPAKGYYTNIETAILAQRAFDDPDVRILLDAKKDLSPQDLTTVINLIKRLKRGGSNE